MDHTAVWYWTTTARTGWIVIFRSYAQLLFASFSSCLRSFALGVPVRLLYLFHVRACKNVIISSRCFSRYLTAFVDKHVQDVYTTTKSYAYPYCTRGRGWATRDGRRATPPSTCGPASHLPTALSSVFLTLLGTHCHSPAPVPCHATAHASAQRSITLAPFRVPVGGRDVPRCHAAHGAPRSEFIHTHAPNMYCADHLLALTGHVPSTSEKLGSSCRQSA